jgi:hypothetical protein
MRLNQERRNDAGKDAPERLAKDVAARAAAA